MPKEPQLTTTTGYFNGNKHRMTINSNALRLNITLEAGEFIKERLSDGRLGRNINDPRLDTFCQPNGLAKQLGDPVPSVLLSLESYSGTGITASPAKPQPMPVARTISPNRQVQRNPTNVTITDRPIPPRPALPSLTHAGSPGFSGGKIAVKANPPGVTPPGINPAVRAMSVKEAEERGVIARAHAPIDGPNAESGLDARNAPYVDDVGMPGHRPAQAPLRQPPRVTITTAVGREPTPVVLPEPVLTLTDANAVIPESDIYADDGAGDAEEVVVSSHNVAESANLVNPPVAKPFVCAADGKAYSHYSTLSKHVRKNYPDRADELLAPYQARTNAAPGE